MFIMPEQVDKTAVNITEIDSDFLKLQSNIRNSFMLRVRKHIDFHKFSIL